MEGRQTDCMKTRTPLRLAVLSVARLQRGLDFLRSYTLELDGQPLARLSARETHFIAIPPGRYSARVRIDWCRSEEIVFEAKPGETVHLECCSRAFGWRRILSSFRRLFQPSKYLWLRQVFPFPQGPPGVTPAPASTSTPPSRPPVEREPIAA